MKKYLNDFMVECDYLDSDREFLLNAYEKIATNETANEEWHVHRFLHQCFVRFCIQCADRDPDAFGFAVHTAACFCSGTYAGRRSGLGAGPER